MWRKVLWRLEQKLEHYMMMNNSGPCSCCPGGSHPPIDTMDLKIKIRKVKKFIKQKGYSYDEMHGKELHK